jgi:hypothetical protein
MSKSITIDAATAAKLNGTEEPAFLLDESGHLVGYFSPRPTGDIPPYVPEFSEEDLDRWEAEPGGRSLKEIMADLSKLP